MDLVLLWQWTNCSWAVGTTRHLLCLMRQPVYIPPCFSTLGDTSLFHRSIPTAGVNTPAYIFMGFIPVKFLSLIFFSLYNRSQNKEAKPLLRKLGSNGLKGSCSTFFYRYIQHHAELWKEDIEQLFIHYHISSSRSLSHSHLHKYRSSCADIKTKIKNTQANLKCL